MKWQMHAEEVVVEEEEVAEVVVEVAEAAEQVLQHEVGILRVGKSQVVRPHPAPQQVGNDLRMTITGLHQDQFLDQCHIQGPMFTHQIYSGHLQG
jgi:hypothetical protein